VQPKVLDINDVITGLEHMVRRLIGEDIEIVLGLEPALGYVRADPGRSSRCCQPRVNAATRLPKVG